MDNNSLNLFQQMGKNFEDELNLNRQFTFMTDDVLGIDSGFQNRRKKSAFYL